jgi:centromeric protein E
VDAKEEIVTTPGQVFTLLQNGEMHRHVGVTNMNERSSRSHTIFRIVIESREVKMTQSKEKKSPKRNSGGKTSLEGGAVKVSCLHLVDLAGSERISLTGAEGQRLKEGAHINKSLLTLSTVIQRLAEGQEGWVPFSTFEI